MKEKVEPTGTMQGEPSTVQPAGGKLRELAQMLIPPPSIDEAQLLRKVRPYTMVGVPRLRAIYRLANRAIAQGVPGAFVECGTCNGGSGAILAHVAARDRRPVWLFDSFEGLPEPAPEDGESAAGWKGQCLGQEAMVEQVLKRVDARIDDVHIVKGWFEDTLASAPTGPIAVLHLDGDWYESTRQILNTLYDRVDPRGFLLVDDYGHWPGCKRAVDEFFAERRLSPSIVQSDYTGVWFAKPAA
jgi:hypothetical protein